MLLLLDEENRSLATLGKAMLFRNSGSSGNLTIGNAVLEIGEIWQPYNR